MTDFELIILLVTIGVLLVNLAQKIKIPYPVVLVIGGGLLSFLPGLDFTYFDPNLILSIVLPPILYHAAFWISVKESRKYLGEICSLALGLVIITTLCIGLLFKWCFTDYPWALAFAFGAIVSPPDATSATSVLKRFSIHSKLTTILEGESLVNDASALVLYRIAVASLLTGTFSIWDASLQFVLMAAGGILFGIAMGMAIQTFSQRILKPVVGTVFSLLIPYITYIFASYLDVSSVLAVVASGIISSRMLFTHPSPVRRMLGHTTWDMFILLLNCFIFILIGSQLDEQTHNMSWHQILGLTGYAFGFTLMMFLIRLTWVCIRSTIDYMRVQDDPKRTAESGKILRDGAIIGWAGMRGIVSLTAALALPFTLADGSPLPGRSEVIYMVFCVIMFTLILPGLTLEPLIGLLHIPKAVEQAEAHTLRQHLARVANDELKRLQQAKSISGEQFAHLHEYLRSRFHSKEICSARTAIIQAERKALLEMWNRGQVDDKVHALLAFELDQEEMQDSKTDD